MSMLQRLREAAKTCDHNWVQGRAKAPTWRADDSSDDYMQCTECTIRTYRRHDGTWPTLPARGME